MPKISVIMGIYNSDSADILKRAIDSILNQTFDDFEFIICEDGSTNNTYHIIEELISNDNRCVLLQNKTNKGLTYSLNKCLSRCTGEYIARMDADDISEPNRFEKQVEFLNRNEEYAFCGSIINKFDETGIYCTLKMKEKPLKTDFFWSNPFVHPSIMIKKAALLDVKGYRDIKKTERCEDYDLWFRLYEHGYKGYNIQECLLNYYEGRDSFLKRKYKYRINEAKVRLEGYSRLNLLPKGYLYVIKPLIVGFIPNLIKKRIWKFGGMQ